MRMLDLKAQIDLLVERNFLLENVLLLIERMKKENIDARTELVNSLKREKS